MFHAMLLGVNVIAAVQTLLSTCSSTPSRNKDSGLGSFTSSSISACVTKESSSPYNGFTFSIENILGLSDPKEQQAPLDLSIRAPNQRPSFGCRYCSKTYSSRSAVR